MKKLQEMGKWGKEFLPVILIAALVAGVLHGYVAPHFETVQASTDLVGLLNQTEDQTSDQTKDQSQNKKKKRVQKKAEKTVKSEDTAAIETVTESGTYKDGTYTGQSQGFGGTVGVSVTITEGKIASIEVTEASGEGADFLARAKGLIQVILSTQSTNVDAVSGATYTSKGIIGAVRDALAKAAVDPASVENSTDTSSDPASGTTTVTPGTFPYKSGVYNGTGTGFSGNITVAIVIEDQALKAAVITESSDDDTFLSRAKAILTQMVTNQNIEVDVVSGATYSSNGIIEAVNNAIKAAKDATDGETNPAEEQEDPDESEDPDSGEDTPDQEDKNTYADGTYEVTVPCEPDERNAFDTYDLSMKVKIEKDAITAITDVTGSGEDYNPMNQTFIDRAVKGTDTVKGMVEKILSKGDVTKVDVVSGATCTSNSIIAGCKEAQKQAKKVQSDSESGEEGEDGSGSGDDGSEGEDGSGSGDDGTGEDGSGSGDDGAGEDGSGTGDDETEEGEGGEDGSADGTGSYKDGTYYVTAKCEPDHYYDFESYTISMTVVIRNHIITGISDIKGTGATYDSLNDYYISRAANGTSKYKGIIAQVTEKGLPENVDAVSGATCSSNAIIEGCKAALTAALQ